MKRAAGILLGLVLSGVGAAATFTVTTSADAGAGSLRQAILDSNAAFGADEIQFAIPGSGVHTIALASALPAITDPVILDGYSQPGSSPNTLPVGQGLNTVLTIEIDGTGAGSSPCLTVNAGNGKLFVMAVQGLVVNRCAQTTILVGADGDFASIAGNFIGTDPAGTSRPGSSDSVGIRVEGANGVDIGGTTAFERNLIACFDGAAVRIADSNGSAVRGNLIGTNAAGDAIVPASPGVENTGVAVSSAATAAVGGATDAEGNVIDGFANGILLSDNASIVRRNRIGTDVSGTVALGNYIGIATNSTAQPMIQENVVSGNAIGIDSAGANPTIVGNFIGTDAGATLDIGNLDIGIWVSGGGAVIGGLNTGEGNTIAYNASRSRGNGGIVVDGIAVARIRANRIFSNARMAIDLELDGVTPNDPLDADGGANARQNFPQITSVVPGASTTHVEGRLQSLQNETFDLDFFEAPICNPNPHDPPQAESYLGSLSGVTTDFSGVATFSTDLPVVLDPGRRVVATATDFFGGTSELSAGLLISMYPSNGPAAGGVTATLYGMEFEAGATVLVGGTPATNVDVMNPGTISVTIPAESAGAFYDVTVTNPNGTVGVISHGWLADFLDVPDGHIFHDYVTRLVLNGLGTGIGGGLYGVENGTLRQQMSVFLLKGEHGACFVPPPCVGIFADVPCSSPFASWIEALAAEGITGGCGTGQYCPLSAVRRDQMAVFILKAEHGSSYVPPACTGSFADVPCPSLFADWIEALAAEGITGGCGGGNYCPLADTTRGQMAVFITRAFHLQ